MISKKRVWRLFAVLVCVALVAALTTSTTSAANRNLQDDSGGATPTDVSAPAEPLHVDLRALELAPAQGQVAPPEGEGDTDGTGLVVPEPTVDGAVQLSEVDAGDAPGGVADGLTAPNLNFPGITSTVRVPDTVGDVGPNHYVQMVNATQFQIWDKAGNSLLGPSSFGGIWPAGDPCANNLGDPIVIYDQFADRWLLSQFARNAAQTSFWMCIAVSTTADPTTTYSLYTLPTTAFPDYPKFGAWQDGYYMSSFEGANLGIYVFDRATMLAGLATTFLSTTIPSLPAAAGARVTRILPADIDGPAPPAGTPVPFVRTVDGVQDTGNPVDRVEVWEATVDWGTNTLNFALADTLTPAPFAIMLCNRNGGNDVRDCLPQPDMEDTLDALSNRPMMQLKYRTFAGGDALVFNQTVNVAGSIPGLGFVPVNEVAGIRWYDLRDAAGTWTIGQQGTYAPQPAVVDDESELIHRWMGSAAIDQAGNIGLAYSVVNGDSDDGEEIYPGIRYTGRLAGDPAGLMTQPEMIIANGTISQGSNNGVVQSRRWGDYSALTVDPTDDCTFWYTNQLAGGLPAVPIPTRIATFGFDECPSLPPVADANGPYVTNEGVDVALDGTGSTDPEGGALTYEWDFDNDGMFDDAIGAMPLFTMVGQDGVFPVSLRVTDPDGLTDTDSTTVTVNNVAPSITFLSVSPATLDENAAFTLSGTATDPGWLDALTATVDWDDGAGPQAVPVTVENVRPDATLQFSVQHIYGDNGLFTPQVCVADDDTFVCVNAPSVTVNNVAPNAEIDETGAVNVGGTPTIVAAAGEPVDFSGRSTDPGSDDLRLSWDWGDGAPSPDVVTDYLVNPPATDPAKSPSIQPRDVTDMQVHAFGDACLYEVTFSALDDDGGTASDTIAVVITGNAYEIRSPGYWYQQYRQGSAQKLDDDTLACYLLIVDFMSDVFNEVTDASTFAKAKDLLKASAKVETDQFDRHLLAAWLNFANGSIGLDTLVDVDGDGTLDDTFANVLANAEAVRLNPASTRAQILAQKDILDRLNNLSNPTVSPGYGVLNEGAAPGPLSISVTLSKQWGDEVTVDWTTLNLAGPGLATAGADFAPGGGTVTFAPGETAKTVDITIIDDALVEPALLWGEWLLAGFTNVSPNANLDMSFFGAGIGIIIDDD